MRDSESLSDDPMDDEEQEVEDLTKPKDHDYRLYTLLHIERDATEDQIKKAYRKQSLKIHPDKNPNDPEAANKFQKLNEAYVILSDEKKRKHYDLTGEIDQENLNELVNKCRFFYKEFTTDDIDDFATRYKNSSDEQEDLINFYEEFEGDVTKILEWIPLSTNSDVERFVHIFDKLIKDKKIKAYKAYKETKNNIKLLQEDREEEKEASELKENVSLSKFID